MIRLLKCLVLILSFLFIGCGEKPLKYGTIQEAASNGDLADLKNHIRRGIAINDRDDYGRTPLHEAVDKNHEEIVRYLISKECDVTLRSNNEYTPLHLAAWNGNISLVELLLSKGVEINAQDFRGRTPLHCALRGLNKNAFDVVKILIANGADINAEIKRREDIFENWGEVIKDTSFGDLRIYEGSTPLHFAITVNNVDAVKLLIEKGADIEAPCGRFKTTPLLLAAGLCNIDLGAKVRFSRLEIGKLLIENGADVNAQTTDFDSYSPLHLSVLMNDFPFASLLLENGADINLKARYDTIYEIAKGEMLKLLLEKSKHEFTNELNVFDLMTEAIRKNEPEVVKLFADHKLNINFRGYNKKTLLHVTVEENRVEIAKILIAHGAEIDAKDKKGETPLHRAIKYAENVEMVKLLVMAGANIDELDEDDKSPLMSARRLRSQKGKDIESFLMSKGAIDFEAASKNYNQAIKYIKNKDYVKAKEFFHATRAVAPNYKDARKHEDVCDVVIHYNDRTAEVFTLIGKGKYFDVETISKKLKKITQLDRSSLTSSAQSIYDDYEFKRMILLTYCDVYRLYQSGEAEKAIGLYESVSKNYDGVNLIVDDSVIHIKAVLAAYNRAIEANQKQLFKEVIDLEPDPKIFYHQSALKILNELEKKE